MQVALKAASRWFRDVGQVVEGVAEAAIESQLLEDLGQVGGVVGALCRIGARVLPTPTAEERITKTLVNTFFSTVKEIVDADEDTTTDDMRAYLEGDRAEPLTRETLKDEFTWLSLLTPTGVRPRDEWPLVTDLADLGEAWLIAARSSEAPASEETRGWARRARGHIVEAMVTSLSNLAEQEEIQDAIERMQERTSTEALELLAELQQELDQYLLFGEVPQHQLYVPSRAKAVDLAGEETDFKWDDIEVADQRAEDIVFEAIASGQPKLVVIEGEMGIGKSCLMRALTARAAQRFLVDKRNPPIYGRWRDIYDRPDLDAALVHRLYADYRVALKDLELRENVLFIIDGFDEMASHDEGHIHECFDRFLGLIDRGCSVVVAMRSAVVTQGLKATWRRKQALVVRLEAFDKGMLETWAENWSAVSGLPPVTGEELMSLAEDEELTENPLLLYMLAKYVAPETAVAGQRMSRTEIFKTFVDETITGKLLASREYFPTDFRPQEYRLILQELAAIASRPNCGRRCPRHTVEEALPRDLFERLSLPSLRTAFVLHFFEPGGLDEFTFHPDGFREYLLAEWCVRAQFEALPARPGPRDHPLVRHQDEARNLLAQVALDHDEGALLNDVYEEIGALAAQNSTQLVFRLHDFAVDTANPQEALALAEALYQDARMHSQEPPNVRWEDRNWGVPEGQEVPRALNELRLLVNYWEQCLLAAFGLYRGLEKDPLTDPLLAARPDAIASFHRAAAAARGPRGALRLRYCRLGLQNAVIEISGHLAVSERAPDFTGANLTEARLLSYGFMATTRQLLGSRIGWERFYGGPLLVETNFTGARMRRAVLTATVLGRARFVDTDLQGAKLDACDLRGADLSHADLRGANLQVADLRGATFRGADLTNADLDSADLDGADMEGATLSHARVSLAGTKGQPAVMPDGSPPSHEDEST